MRAVDVAALSVAIAIAATITAVVALFGSTGTRRDWTIAGMMAALFMAIGVIDLLGETPRETHLATAVVGALLPAAGATGIARGMRRARPWVRWLVVFLFTFVLLMGGLIFGASILPRFIGG